MTDYHSTFQVTVIEGKNLPAMDSNGLSDPYVVLSCSGFTKQTQVIKKSLNPKWNETFSFEISSVHEPFFLQVYDYDIFGKDKMGNVSINFSDLLNDKQTDVWIKLPTQGEVHLKFDFSEFEKAPKEFFSLEKSKNDVSSIDVFGVIQKDGTMKVSPMFMIFKQKKHEKEVFIEDVEVFINDVRMSWKLAVDPKTEKAYVKEHKDKTNYEYFMPTEKNCAEMLKALEDTSKVAPINTIIFKNGNVQSVSTFFVFQHTDKLLVSDIDGTVTKSDKTGLTSTFLGLDYTHEGCPLVLSAFEKEGFKIIYLTARSVRLANMSKDYIRKIDQNGVKMPRGPVVTTPDHTLDAINREVIQKTPHEFKIEILTRFISLFPSNPIVVGLGNRETDDKAYSMVGVPKIFRINKQSVISVGDKEVYPGGYTEMAKDVKNILK